MIEFKKEDKKITCRITEEIIASKIPEMRNRLSSFLDHNQVWDELIFDCSAVNTLDSIGVNFIVGAYKKANSLNRCFKTYGCNETVTKVLKLFKLDDMFAIEATGL